MKLKTAPYTQIQCGPPFLTVFCMKSMSQGVHGSTPCEFLFSRHGSGLSRVVPLTGGDFNILS
jgi:hypothetical protein